jgi:hypothetical protein
MSCSQSLNLHRQDFSKLLSFFCIYNIRATFLTFRGRENALCQAFYICRRVDCSSCNNILDNMVLILIHINELFIGCL